MKLIADCASSLPWQELGPLHVDWLAALLVALLASLLCYGTAESSYFNNGEPCPLSLVTIFMQCLFAGKQVAKINWRIAKGSDDHHQTQHSAEVQHLDQVFILGDALVYANLQATHRLLACLAFVCETL